jgi:hypothetical protein
MLQILLLLLLFRPGYKWRWLLREGRVTNGMGTTIATFIAPPLQTRVTRINAQARPRGDPGPTPRCKVRPPRFHKGALVHASAGRVQYQPSQGNGLADNGGKEAEATQVHAMSVRLASNDKQALKQRVTNNIKEI